MSIKVGDSVWVFDVNHRVYEDNNGNRTSSPVWLQHWRERKIESETSRSWVLNYFGKKIPKKGYDCRDVCFSMEEVLDRAWVHDNQYKIESAIRGLSHEKLREVAMVIGYKAKEG
jgi:hypothetical protein